MLYGRIAAVAGRNSGTRFSHTLRRAAKASHWCRSSALIAAVLEKRLGVNLWDQDIYLNVVGGLQVEEPAADLAIAGAILSSLFGRPIGASTVIFGEVGLGGEIRPAMFTDVRLKEASLLGFKRGIIPAHSTAEESPSLMETLRVSDLRQAQEVFFS
ncbi:MAG: hypothetical protein DMG14_11460 [Acidobacteria bacterium]|nr:MAG: hypothetical protein DMG14_11460 [Acidobacteriota bacterium]